MPTIKYTSNSQETYKILQTDVSDYLKTKSNFQFADKGMIVKIIFCISLYVLVYVQYLNTSSGYLQWLFWCFAFGCANLLIGVNIAHDAIHQALFRKKWLNSLAGFSFDLIGISSYTWKLKHNYIHHNYPNVLDVDVDIDAGPILRFSPADKKRWFHKYQYLYAPFVYILFSLHLVFINDALILSNPKRFGLSKLRKRKRIYFLILLQKCAYLFLVLILPAILLPFSWWSVLAGFLLMHFTLSLLLAIVLLPSHLFENTSFSPVTAKGEIEEDWTLHQLSTTLDFATQNRLVHFIFGGFNTNVVHHLFPSVCHCHYRKLAAIISNKTRELGLPYHQTSLKGAIASHFRAIKRLGV